MSEVGMGCPKCPYCHTVNPIHISDFNFWGDDGDFDCVECKKCFSVKIDYEINESSGVD
jgi:hypothetical protein